jgi:hypothetical protein
MEPVSFLRLKSVITLDALRKAVLGFGFVDDIEGLTDIALANAQTVE